MSAAQELQGLETALEAIRNRRLEVVWSCSKEWAYGQGVSE